MLGSIRKTPMMLLIEERHAGKHIRQVIRETLLQCHGEYRAAAKVLGVSAASFSGWIKELQLTTEASKIREAFDLPQTLGEIRLEKDKTGKFHIEEAAVGNCTACDLTIHHLREPLDYKGITHKETGDELFVELRDANGDRHWFKLEHSAIDKIPG